MTDNTSKTSPNGTNGTNSGNGVAISEEIPQGITVYAPVERPKQHNDVSLTMPQSVVDRMWLYAEKFADSTLYKKNGLTRASDYFIAFGKGYELGIPLFQTFDYIYQVSGKLCTDGKGMVALLRMRPEVDDIEIDEQPDKATVTIKMTDGRSYTVSFTQAEAEQAKLTGKEGWEKYPSAMRVWRALSKLVRFYLPHLVGGLVYTKEELEVVDTIKDPQSKKAREFDEYFAEVAKDYEDTHWFMVNPRPFVGILRRDVPQWKDLEPVAVLKKGLETLGIASWAEFASGRDAINAIKAKLGITDTSPSNIIHMPADKQNASTEPPPPPVEYDPLTGNAVNNTPSPKPNGATPSSTAPEELAPDDVRNHIKTYGADHWFIKNADAFFKMLRYVTPNNDSMTNEELSAHALKIVNAKNWKGFKTGWLAFTFYCQELGITAPSYEEITGTKPQASIPASKPPTESKPQTPPTAPKPTQTVPAPAPTPAPPPNWHTAFVDWLYTYFDMKSIAEWEAKSGKSITDYKTLADAQADTTNIARMNHWDILTTTAKYFSIGRDTYIEFHSLFIVRMYGRSSKFKQQVGDEYYAEYGVDAWKPNGEYEIGLLRVSWKPNEKGLAIAHTVTVLGDGEGDDAYPSDLTPEEEKALAEVQFDA